MGPKADARGELPAVGEDDGEPKKSTFFAKHWTKMLGVGAAVVATGVGIYAAGASDGSTASDGKNTNNVTGDVNGSFLPNVTGKVAAGLGLGALGLAGAAVAYKKWSEGDNATDNATTESSDSVEISVTSVSSAARTEELETSAEEKSGEKEDSNLLMYLYIAGAALLLAIVTFFCFCRSKASPEELPVGDDRV